MEESIFNKNVKLQNRRTHPNYRESDDFALEAEINYEKDLLEQAKGLHENGPDAFKPALKITYENFKLKQHIRTLEGQFTENLGEC